MGNNALVNNVHTKYGTMKSVEKQLVAQLALQT